MLRMRKTDHEKRWMVEELELGDVTKPLHQPQVPISAAQQKAEADAEGLPREAASRHKTFKVDGLVAVTTALKVLAGLVVGFLFFGGPILCCLLTLTLFYLLVEYSTKAERQQERDQVAQMERQLSRGSIGLVDVMRFLVSNIARMYQRLVALKQSVVNYSLTVSISESQAMLDLDEIVHGRRRRRSSLLPCVESECEDLLGDRASQMEGIVVVDRNEVSKLPPVKMVEHTRVLPPSKPYELQPIHLETLHTDRSSTLSSSEDTEPESEDIEVEIEPIEIEPVVTPPPPAKPLTPPPAAAAPIAVAVKVPAKLQIPVILSRPYPRLIVKPLPSKLTPSQQVNRMKGDADKMLQEMQDLLAWNAEFSRVFEESHAQLQRELRRRHRVAELSHDALSSEEEEGEFWYEDALGEAFLDDVPAYLLHGTSA